MKAGGTRSKPMLSTFSGRSCEPLETPRNRSSGCPEANSASSSAPPGPITVVRAQSCPCIRSSASEVRSEEHTSELQSRFDLVCRLLLAPSQRSPLLPYTTLFRSWDEVEADAQHVLRQILRTAGDAEEQVVGMSGGEFGEFIGAAGTDHRRQGAVLPVHPLQCLRGEIGRAHV